MNGTLCGKTPRSGLASGVYTLYVCNATRYGLRGLYANTLRQAAVPRVECLGSALVGAAQHCELRNAVSGFEGVEVVVLRVRVSAPRSVTTTLFVFRPNVLAWFDIVKWARQSWVSWFLTRTQAGRAHSEHRAAIIMARLAVHASPLTSAVAYRGPIVVGSCGASQSIGAF